MPEVPTPVRVEASSYLLNPGISEAQKFAEVLSNMKLEGAAQACMKFDPM